MGEIEFYGLEINELGSNIDRVSFTDHILDGASEKDLEIINDTWRNKSKPHWVNGALGSLYDTTSALFFNRSEFKVYLAVSDPANRKRISPYLIDESRSSSVGSVIQTIDDYFIVQRRGKEVANASYRLDSSASGMANLKDLRIKFKDIIEKKAIDELKLSNSDFIDFEYTGVHRGLDFTSSQVSFYGKVGMEFEEIKRAVDPEYTGDYSRIAGVYGIKSKDLQSFLIDNANEDRGFIDDGLATFMRVLDEDSFFHVAKELVKRGRNIKFGDLVKGEFVENKDLRERLY
jgi:hypothetical protein